MDGVRWLGSAGEPMDLEGDIWAVIVEILLVFGIRPASNVLKSTKKRKSNAEDAGYDGLERREQMCWTRGSNSIQNSKDIGESNKTNENRRYVVVFR